MATYFVIFIEGECRGHVGIDQETGLEGPSTGDVAHGVTTSSEDQGWKIEALDKLDTIGMSLHAQIEAAQAISRQTVTTALEDDGIGRVVLHDARDDGLKDGLVCGVVNSISEGEVDSIVFALSDTDIAKLAGSGEVLAVLVEGDRHDSIGRVEGLFDAITVMHVNIDVQDALVEPQKLQDTQDDVWRGGVSLLSRRGVATRLFALRVRTIDIAEAACLALLCVVQTASPIDSNVALLAVQSCSALHGATRADAAELEQTIEDRTIVADIELGLLTNVALHVLWADLLEKVDVFIGVELAHLESCGRLGPIDLHLLVHAIVHN